MSDHVLSKFAPPAPSPARRGGGRPGGPDSRRHRTQSARRWRVATGCLQSWCTTGWLALRTAWRRHQTRHCLLGLNDHLRKDIGISYADAEAEGNKPFWAA